MNQSSRQHMRVWGARVVQTVGWTGAVGTGLLLAAVVFLTLEHRSTRAIPIDLAVGETPSSPANAPALEHVLKQRAPLPPVTDVPLFLTQIQQAVVVNGLSWSQADYKIASATEDLPATLEVRCTLKGSYPKVRSLLAQILREVPGIAIRELVIGRSSPDQQDIQAKLVVAVFLDDVPTAPRATAAQQGQTQ